MHEHRTGSNRIERKTAEYSNFDMATGLHGHHRWGVEAASFTVATFCAPRATRVEPAFQRELVQIAHARGGTN
jgi:hypothetical protein